jgi:imidazolonepropionase-like amidohydrolase
MRECRILPALLVLAACGGQGSPTGSASPPSAPLALVNGSLIDGTGAPPLADAAVVVRGDRVVDAGPRTAVSIPAHASVVDVTGSLILPGFINAHVHEAFDASRLRTWAQAGVTTVRDMEILDTGSGVLASQMALGCYGRTYVTSPEEARRWGQEHLDLGVDVTKFSLETGYANLHDLPLLTPEEVAAIVTETHARGRRVTAHITQARFLREIVEAGADEAAHMPYDALSDELIQSMVAAGFVVVPTLTVLEAYGALLGTSHNLGRFVAAGGEVALGNDYTSVPQNGFDHFELGMPMHKIRRMHEAGMTTMQIVVAATKTAARTCGLEGTLGTVATGKVADILVVNACSVAVDQPGLRSPAS